MDGYRLRTLLSTRDHLVGISTGLINKIRGTLKTFGVLLGPGKGGTLERAVRQKMPNDPVVSGVIEGLLDQWRSIQCQKRQIDNELARVARRDPVLRLFCTAPGIRAITAVSFATTIGDPCRFRRLTDVGAYLGLTPKRYQSGEVNRAGRITKRGNRLTRKLLFEAATLIMTRTTGPSALRDWSDGVAARSGTWKARVALARKLAAVLLRMWRTGRPYSPYPDAA